MPVTIRSLLSGRPAYVSKTPWGPIDGLAAVGLILLLCLFVFPLSLYAASPEIYAKAGGELGLPRLWAFPASPAFALATQAAMIWLIWLASGMRGGNQVNVLSLNHPAGGIGIMWTLAALIWVLTFPMSFLIKEPVGGFQIVGLRSVIPNEAWLQYFPIAKVISFVVAAPLVEEFMFRGFLLSALAPTKLGFWGAALVTNALWVSMHFSYPWHAFPMIFVLVLFLRFAVWKTGSVWTTVIGHGLYNLEPALLQFIFVRS